MSLSWSGYAYVDEPSITPEQYKMFFDRCACGISFKTANQILSENSNGDYSELVPADELDAFARIAIIDQILEGNLTGNISYETFEIKWKWDPVIIDDAGLPISFEILTDEHKLQILHQMLEEESHWGIID